MKYSIIIPTLNEELLLPDLLTVLYNPILKNKYNYEIIISDGGSKDNTIQISKKYADLTLEQENNDIRTIAFGRHKGVLYSSGEIIIFLNADVRIGNLDNFFLCIENKFVNSKYKAMTCKIKTFPEKERFSDKLFSQFLNSYVFLLNILGIGMARGECQILYKNMYYEVGGYNINLSAGEDFELSTRIRKKGKILFERSITLYESPRRYHAWGYLRIMFSWFMNSTSSWIFNKSIFKKWEPIR